MEINFQSETVLVNEEGQYITQIWWDGVLVYDGQNEIDESDEMGEYVDQKAQELWPEKYAEY